MKLGLENFEQKYAEADALEASGRHQQAFEIFLSLAENGHVDSMCRVGSLYENGEGVEANFERAVYWERRASDSGSFIGTFNLGVTLRKYGRLRDARYLFEKCLENGIGDAAIELAKMYLVSDKELDTVEGYLKRALSANDLLEADYEEAKKMMKELKLLREGGLTSSS